MLFPKKKATDNTTEKNFYGFTFDTQPLTVCSNRALACAMKGLFIFAAVFGTIGGVISSFDLPCHLTLIAGLLLFFSMLLAFLHYSRFVFNVCYPIIFIMFAYAIFSYRYQVYSGFQAFLAIWQEKYSSYYAVSILREAHEYFSDRTMTITFTAVFIGFFLGVLLNIAISEYMNLPAVILLTFPLFQMGIFIEEMPDFIYLVLLLFSYFMVAIMKRSGHYLLPYREKKRTEFFYKEKKQTQIWRYHASGRITLQLTALFFAFSMLLGIFCMPLLATSTTTGALSRTRKQVDEYMKILTQSGLAGFFNRYEATGGISGGRLGGVSTVRPDYEADLNITFVPYSYETLYLKAYTGKTYFSTGWEAPEPVNQFLERQLGEEYSAYEKYTAFLESKRLQHYMDTHKDTGIYGKMEVKNLGAASNYIYLPYYSSDEISTSYKTEGSVISASLPEGESFTVNYYPLLRDYWEINPQPDEMLADLDPSSSEANYIRHYDAVSNSDYLQIPDTIKDELLTYTDKIGHAANVDSQISMIMQYLDDNYSYSMAPGRTPNDKDYVLYFLEEQKQGYCAHFATTATLLLRSYGIPARYVEGYAVSFREIAEGEAVDAPYEEWFTGTNPLGETGVVSVDVTDAAAHAWVEVYKTGIGWVPYDFTPADDSTDYDSQDSYNNFWSLFSGIFRGTPPPETVDAAGNQQQELSSFLDNTFGSTAFLVRPLLIFVGILLCFLLCFTVGKTLLYRIRLKRAYKNGHYDLLLAFYYRRLCSILKKKQLISGEFLLPTKLPLLETPDVTLDRAELEMYMELLEKCCYSQHTITGKDADELLLYLKKLCKECSKKIK